jgi:hypothetical protein
MSRTARIERRARATATWACTDAAATWAFKVALVIAVPVMYIVGRHQWFIRDDWSFILTRQQIRQQFGWDEWLLLPTIGHWMTAPLLAFRTIENLFGIDSYWPFLLLNMLVHLGIVLAVRELCRRIGAHEWTTTLVCVGLLVFGAGWENIVFAIQITYGFSLLAFLLQLLLVDHDGPADRRDIVGSVLAIVGVMSSGFGPFFLVGIAALLTLRRRWIALAVAVVPQGLALAWWWLAWGDRSPEASTSGPIAMVPAYALRGVVAVFESLAGLAGLGAFAAAGTLAVALSRRSGYRNQTTQITLWVTAAAMYVGLGTQRTAFGIENAAISRYQYMGAMLLAPAFAVAVDLLRRWCSEAVWVSRALLSIAIVLGLGTLRTESANWAIRADGERRVLELIAGSGLVDQADPDHQPLPFSPDVRVRSIPMLVERDAIVPRSPSTPDEVALVRAALGLTPAP